MLSPSCSYSFLLNGGRVLGNTGAVLYVSLVLPLLVASVRSSSPKHGDLAARRSNKHSCSRVTPAASRLTARLLPKLAVARVQVEADGFEVEV